MRVTVTCVGCSKSFEAGTARAKWCSSACRKRVQRAGHAKTAQEPAAAPADDVEPTPSALVDEVTRELVAAGRLTSFHGQLAVQLARRLSQPDESGISSLSKELRLVMAAALDGSAPTVAVEEPDEPDDEITKARRSREQARQAAGFA